jgi:hypothetical protein
VTEGTPEPNPEPPDVTGTQEPLAFVSVPAEATDIPDEDVLNWRAQPGGGFDPALEEPLTYDPAFDGPAVDVSDRSSPQLTTVVKSNSDVPSEKGVRNGVSIDIGNSEGLSVFYTTTGYSFFGGPDGWWSDSYMEHHLVDNIVCEWYAHRTGDSVNESAYEHYVGQINWDYDEDRGQLLIDHIEAANGSTVSMNSAVLEGNTVFTGGITHSSVGSIWNQTENWWDPAVTPPIRRTLSIDGGTGGTVGNDSYDAVGIDTSQGGPTDMTLQSATVAQTGYSFLFYDSGGQAESNPINITTEGSATINGASSYTMDTDYGAVLLTSDGTNWYTTVTPGGGASVAVEDDGSSVLPETEGLNFGTALSVTDDGDGTVTVDGEGGVSVEDDGSSVESPASGINFGTDLAVSADGDGSVTVNGSTTGVTVLAEGTFTHTGGSASSTTVANVTTDQTVALQTEVGVDADPGFSADYGWDYTAGELWDDANGEKDVTIDATWTTDPGSGNDVTLRYRIYTLDVSFSPTEIQRLVNSPNGNVPTALLDDGESVEITTPVPDGETLSVYRWGAYTVAGGAAPSGLEAQLLDGSDTVQASENTVNTESTSGAVASHTNTSGSVSVFKLRVNNSTGTAYTTDGVSGIFAYAVE